jgi:hypothetical protein
MITTDRLVSLDAVGREGMDLIHFTGPLQVVARAATAPPDGIAPQVELRVDAARVRGVDLKTGARYWANGVHQSRHEPGEVAAPFDVQARFELLGCAPDGSQRRQLTLTVRFRVTVPTDGRVTVTAGAVELLPPIGRSHVTRR